MLRLFILLPFAFNALSDTIRSDLQHKIHSQCATNLMDRKVSLQDSAANNIAPTQPLESTAPVLTGQQLVLQEWWQSVKENRSRDQDVNDLDMVLKRDVVQLLRNHSSASPKIRFEPHCQLNISSSSHDALGKLFVFKPHCHMQSMTCGETMQSIFAAMNSLAQEIRSAISPRLIIGDIIMVPDWTMEPRRRRSRPIDSKELHDGFGYRFPNLVMDVASAASCQQLLNGLSALMSPETSVQVAIGFMYYICDGSDEAVEKVEAFLFRRNKQNPDQVVQLYPVLHGILPVLTIHLCDLFFGVVNPLPIELRQRVLRDEAITIELDLLQELMLSEYS
jgi:hypothetical protein